MRSYIFWILNTSGYLGIYGKNTYNWIYRKFFYKYFANLWNWLYPKNCWFSKFCKYYSHKNLKRYVSCISLLKGRNIVAASEVQKKNRKLTAGPFDTAWFLILNGMNELFWFLSNPSNLQLVNINIQFLNLKEILVLSQDTFMDKCFTSYKLLHMWYNQENHSCINTSRKNDKLNGVEQKKV